MSIKVLKIDETNLDELAPFAKDVFIDYYLPLLKRPQCEYMVEQFLSKEAILKKLKEGSHFSLYYLDDQKVSFTEYKVDQNRIFLSKLYVHKDYRGQGFGQKMLKEVMTFAKDEGKEAIYLTVNKYNEKTIAIYKHLGFEIIDALISDIGMGYVMDDYIMEKRMAN